VCKVLCYSLYYYYFNALTLNMKFYFLRWKTGMDDGNNFFLSTDRLQKIQIKNLDKLFTSTENSLHLLTSQAALLLATVCQLLIPSAILSLSTASLQFVTVSCYTPGSTCKKRKMKYLILNNNFNITFFILFTLKRCNV